MADRDHPSEVIGMAEYEARLSKLDLFTETDIVKKAGRRTMEAVVERAQSLVPKRSGALAAAIRVRAGRSKPFSWVAGASTRFFKGKSFYGAFIEFGRKTGLRKATAPIGKLKGPERSGGGFTETTGTGFTPTRRDIPGQRYIERAFEETKDSSTEEFEASIKAALDSIDGK